jgi:hypothetical protein
MVPRFLNATNIVAIMAELLPVDPTVGNGLLDMENASLAPAEPPFAMLDHLYKNKKVF